MWPGCPPTLARVYREDSNLDHLLSSFTLKPEQRATQSSPIPFLPLFFTKHCKLKSRVHQISSVKIDLISNADISKLRRAKTFFSLMSRYSAIGKPRSQKYMLASIAMCKTVCSYTSFQRLGPQI
jgi:hypothetical protein